MNYSVDWHKGPAGEADYTSRLFAVSEMSRRAIAATKSTKAIQGEYTEESGLAFPLKLWLMAGGLNLDYPVGQTWNLKKRLGIELIARVPALSEQAPDIFDKGFLREVIGYKVERLPEVTIEVSGRRTYHMAKRVGARALVVNRSINTEGDYELHCHSVDGEASPRHDSNYMPPDWRIVIDEIRRGFTTSIKDSPDGEPRKVISREHFTLLIEVLESLAINGKSNPNEPRTFAEILSLIKA